MTELKTSYSGGSSNNTATTIQVAGESLEDFIDRHFNNTFAAAPSNTQELVTGWKCAGANQRVTTQRQAGEGWRAFFDRHRADAEAEILECPPG